LGLLSKRAEQALLQALESWKTLGIEGWTSGTHPWFNLSREVAALLAPLVGTKAECIGLSDSVTVNLHQLIASFFDPTTGRDCILLDDLAFPTDRYVVQSQLQLRGLSPEQHLKLIPSRDGNTLAEADIITVLQKPNIALAVLPAVLYRSGQLLDMKKITQAGHEAGVHIIWDCSHSVGAIPHQFDKDDIELAVGCTYKYLNGGPGAVAFLYVCQKLLDERVSPRSSGLTGWFGSDPAKQFAMTNEFQPASDAGRFLLGTPHVLSLAPLLGALPMFLEVGVATLREHSLKLTHFLRTMAEAELDSLGVSCITPQAEHQRGGHITLQHPDAKLLSIALRERGVIPDFRAPDLLRLAPAPLYTSYTDIAQAMVILKDLLTTGSYHQSQSHALVT
jgi:kynureninase